MQMKKRALLSVSDKTGLVDFAKGLVNLGFEILSTGGTFKALQDANIPCISVSDITNFPECLDGRVKTLHPNIHAGLLALRNNKDHMAQIEKLGIAPIDVLAVNLYPFKQTILKPNVSFEEAVENIDIGGPTMIRAAAKNYGGVCVVVDPKDYASLLEKLESGNVDTSFRKNLMYKVFAHTAVYDSMISSYLAKQLDIEFPDELTLAYSKKQDLRYGENPHQNAAVYEEQLPVPRSLSSAVQLQGKELSYNNLNDANGALELLKEFKDCTCVAVKHTNPCGVASAKIPPEAFKAALNADPVSIFGGIVAFNRKIDEKTAQELCKIFLEIIIAPDYDKAALKVFESKPNLRVLQIKDLDKADPCCKGKEIKKMDGGLLYQDKDCSICRKEEIKVVTKRKPTKEEQKQLDLAFAVVKHVKSNAIVLAKDNSAIGIAGGQTNRIWAAKQAIERAGKNSKGAVLASDAFFPFNDCVEEAAKAGITAIIQPGGSVRDQDSIDLCDKHNIAMVFVGQRHFKH